ncbi:MAG: penicillin acylase family protein [Melioribacteraceae bacterium]|nr:penicillin acylase family protein [Melioribacteraceae bacterium]
MKKWIKVIIGIFITVFILLIGLYALSHRMLSSSLPDYEGILSSNEIKSSINIYRDSTAVAYIESEHETDAAFALGFVHAQERMFQMDLMRRAGEGRLSEILGSKTLPFDKMFRTIGIYKSLLDNYGKFSDDTKTMLESYSNGVNAYLKSTEDYSFEFKVLGYTPYEWMPVHSLLVAKLMAWELNVSWWTDIAFSHIVQKFGVDKTKEILPDFEENSPTIIPEHIASAGEISLDIVATDRDFREFMGMEGTHIGSNNWVINNKKSESGKVIIANDPHLSLSIPAKWFVSVIRAGNWNADGFTLPGVPAIVIGKNQDISWAITNVMTDDADFYIEKFDSTRTRYLVNDSWKGLSIRKDTIKVKDSSSVVFEIRETHRGPVVSDIHPYKILYPDTIQNITDISMKWTALEFSDEYKAIYGVNTASNWEEFTEALKNFTVPGQNFIYGDKNNNIGYVCAARLPKRTGNSPTLVYDGTTDKNDWQGYVPYSEMPKLYNPEQDYIASANNKTVKHFPYHISNIWEPPSRIDRITSMINSKKQINFNDCVKMQMDFQSAYAPLIVEKIINAFDNTKIADNNLNLAINLLDEWDFVMEKDSQAPAVYLVFLQKLIENIFMDEMGDKLFKEYVFISNIPYRIVTELMNGKKISWIDNISTENVESLEEIIRKSMVDALEFLETGYGDNITYWQWSKLHSLTLRHPFSGTSFLIDKIINAGPFELGGDGTTVFNTEYSFTKPFEIKLGPSMRYIYDFADPEAFYFILPTGQSGHLMSDHYSNMTYGWIEGRYFKVNTNLSVNKDQLKMFFTIDPAN